MRHYESSNEKKLIRAVCNCCGRELQVAEGILKEGCFHARDTFGYFSSQDGTCAEFDLCEACYRKITAGFSVPVTEEDMTELL